MFGGAGREHMQKYGTTARQLAKIAAKNRKHAVANERSQFREASTVDEILASPMIFEPLTKFQCCPTTDGAAAAVVCSEEFARKHGISNPVTIASMAMTTDYPTTFEPKSMIKMVGWDMSQKAAETVYAETGIGPDDV